MDLAKKKRKVQRSTFTKALNHFNETHSSSADLSDVSVAFQLLQDKHEELSETTELIMKALFDVSTSTEEELVKEYDDAEEYKSKFFTARVKYERLQQSSSAVPTVSNVVHTNVAQSEVKKSYYLPRIELNKFSGDIRDWLPFWSLFAKIHNDQNIDNADKFQYLLQAMVPDSRAAELVKSYPPTSDNYEKVITSLKNRYGCKDLQTEVYMRELLQLVLQNAVSPKQEIQLSTLYDKIESHLRSLESLGTTIERCAATLFPLVESSLPEDLLRAWQRSYPTNVSSTIDNVTGGASKDRLTSLMKFLENEVRSEVRITMAIKGFNLKNSNSEKSKKKSYADQRDIPSATSLVNADSRDNKCLFCANSNHESANCFKAKKMDLAERQDLAKQHRACFNCLKIGHNYRSCRVNVKCSKCSRRHVTLMCPGEKQENDTNAAPHKINENTSHGCNMASLSSDPQVYLPTLCVKLRSDNKEKNVRLMIDSGSQKSYITRSAVREMQYKPIAEQKINHSLFGGKKSGVMTHKKYQVCLDSLDNSFACNFSAFDEEVICEEVPLIKRGEWSNELDEKDIKLSDMNNNEQSISVLIGADIAGKFLTGRCHKLKCGLVAVETLLGWSIMGRVPGTENRRDPVVTAIAMFTKDYNITDLWSLDTLGIKDPIERKTKKVQEDEMEENFLQAVMVNADGRYEVDLPWVENHPALGDNKAIATRRLESTIKKLKADGIFKDYDAVFREWLNEGIIEYVPKNEEGNWGHYLPHRHVVKENSTTRIRPVFDASAKDRESPSLNECMQKGPNLIELVSSILLRFREGNLGVVSDIKKAFLQISVRPPDRDFLRFLWVDEEGNSVSFRHCRVVFGVSCSPFILGAVINMHLLKILESSNNANVFDKNNIVKLMKSFYVDNCVTSVNSTDELEKFIIDSKAAMELAGFDLRGWEYVGDDTHEHQAAVLGIVWNKNNDTLSVNTSGLDKFDSKKVTKREILSMAHRIFDPLGFICPAVLTPRVLLQEAWAKKLSWDDEVDVEIRNKFIKWSGDLKRLKDIEISRCVLGQICENDKVSIHVFCDASKLAYAAVIFIRIERGSNVEVNFLQAKNRVAPAKGETCDSKYNIPRLELLAATIGARLAHAVLEVLKFKLYDIYYWSDSSTVLAWIKRECNWSTFVWNRVREIRELSDAKQWRHVPGPWNPADLPSRGCTVTQLISSQWWEGPEWLRLPSENWPNQKFNCDENEINIELKKTSGKVVSSYTSLLSFIKNNDSSVLKRVFDQFSSYNKVLKIIAWMKRFLFNCKCNKTSRKIGNLTVDEINFAEIITLKAIQKESFCGINDDRIKNFNPFVDENGIIRLKSKIILRDDTFNFRCPIILPDKNELVNAIIKNKHVNLKHAGIEITLSALREQFWVLGGRKTVRSVIKKCTACRRHDSQPLQTTSPSLPLNRVRDAAIFEVLGIDFTGHSFDRRTDI